MPEIGALLHDAVPPDDSEPDLDEIAYLASRRRRRRRTARIVLPLAVVVIVSSGLWVFGGDDDQPDLSTEDGVTTTSTTTTPTTTLPDPSATEFAHLLGTRPLLQTTSFATWPLTPEQFFEEFPPDQAVVGTLVEVRPGAVMQDGVCRSATPINGCDSENLETVVDVERWLGPGGGAAGRLPVVWKLGSVPIGADDREADQANREAAVPYQAAAPIGARVLVPLRASEGQYGPYEWVPSAVSAIVIEDGDGVAVPHAQDTHQPIDFDDYVAEVEELLQRR